MKRLICNIGFSQWLRVFVLLLAVTVLFACASPQTTPEWLSGQWQLSHNPANEDEDVFYFKDDGKFEIHTEKGERFSGRYMLKDRFLIMYIQTGASQVEARFTVSEDKTRLEYKTGAYYTRVE